MSDEIRTGLGDLFIKKVIENEKFEYCNRSKAEAAAELSDNHASRFLEWVKGTNLFESNIPVDVLLKMYKNQRGLS